MGDNELSQNDIDALFSGGGEGDPAPPEPNVKEKSPQEAGAPVAEEGPAPKTGTATAVKEPAPEPEPATATAKPPEEKPVAQPVEWCFQIVGNIVRNLLHAIHELFDPLKHGVKVFRQPVQFITRTRYWYAARQIARHDSLAGGGHRIDASQ